MIKIENLTKTYDKRTKRANEVLHGVSLTLPDTGFVCILGASGCGKTSFLNAVGGLDDFDSGTIQTDTATLKASHARLMEKERNASFGYIFQNYYLLSEHSAAYNVYIGMHSLDISHKEKCKRVKDALSDVDMLRFAKRPVCELSGGQQQRVAIARAIARAPKVIFADEPTGNLDEANTVNICSILKELSKKSLVVMVTHEERIARFFASRIITLKDGKIESDTDNVRSGTLDMGKKDTVYTGDLSHSTAEGEGLYVDCYADAGVRGARISVVLEKDRIIIKTDDPRVVLCSDVNSPIYLDKGKRPVVKGEELEENPSDTQKSDPLPQKRAGLGLKMLLAEARSLTLGKKQKKFRAGIFTVILAVMLSLTVADIVTVAHVDPEDFITTDSHSLGFVFEGGKGFDRFVSLRGYIGQYIDFLQGSGLDFDFIPASNTPLRYTDATMPQLEGKFLSFGTVNRVDISRFDEEKLISGRMPERYDEIIVDRFAFDRLVSEGNVVANMLPGAETLLGKYLSYDRMSVKLKVVGISDTGDPSIFMSKEALLAYGVNGSEVITLSEYKRLSGDTTDYELGENGCIILTENVGEHANQSTVNMLLGSEYYFELKYRVSEANGVTAKLVIPDERLLPLYESMIRAGKYFTCWCADKEEFLEFLENNMPSELKESLVVEISDTHSRSMEEYREKTAARLDARTIIVLSALLISLVMLYFMQRNKIRDRMDTVAVYRLLGVPKRDLAFIFAAESAVSSVKYALPATAAVYIVLFVLSQFEELEGFAMFFPLWAAAATFALVLLYSVAVSVLPAIRLLRHTPASLAAKYDF